VADSVDLDDDNDGITDVMKVAIQQMMMVMPRTVIVMQIMMVVLM
jgi:hypothetical protein